MATLSCRAWRVVALAALSARLPLVSGLASRACLALVTGLAGCALLPRLPLVPLLPSLAGSACLAGLSRRARWSWRCGWGRVHIAPGNQQYE
jgi:hypothetical protein